MPTGLTFVLKASVNHLLCLPSPTLLLSVFSRLFESVSFSSTTPRKNQRSTIPFPMCLDWCCMLDLGSCACCLWTFAFARSRSSDFRSSSSSRSRERRRGKRGRGGREDGSASPTRSRAREFGALTMTYFRMPLRELRRAGSSDHQSHRRPSAPAAAAAPQRGAKGSRGGLPLSATAAAAGSAPLQTQSPSTASPPSTGTYSDIN